MSTKSLRVIGAVARPPAHWDDNHDWDWKKNHNDSRKSRSRKSRDNEHDCNW
jgi:hypothetical protein